MAYLAALVVILCAENYVLSTKITKETESHIEHCIDIHQADTTCVMLGTVIQPPLCLPSGHLNENHFLLPKLIIWDPLKRYKLICPTHQQELKPSFWLGKQPQWRQPRMLYDLHGNMLLVGRYLSFDERISKQLPRDLHIPFLLFHRSACTRELVEHVFSLVSEGCTFIEISRKLLNLNYEQFCKRIQNVVDHGLSLEKHELIALTKRILSEFKSTELYGAPSSNLLEVLFLQEFKLRRDSFTKAMRMLAAKTLSVSVLSFDSLWSTQYRHLILVFNDQHQVVTWAFSKSCEFEEVQPLFAGLHNRLVCQNSVPEYVHIDNCCEWRSLFQIQFGLDVKQDIYHTNRRVANMLPRQGSTGFDRNSFQRDFSRIFRSEDDQLEERTKPTPSPSVIQLNLENFIKRWEALGDTTLFNQECKQFLQTLPGHIMRGCFSGIRPGEGSEGKLGLLNIMQNRENSLLSHAKNLGPELLFAVLTVVFHYWNKSNMPRKAAPTGSKKVHPDTKRSKKEEQVTPDPIRIIEPDGSGVKKARFDVDAVDVSSFFSRSNNLPNGSFKEQFGFIGGWQTENSSTIGFSSINGDYQNPPLRYVTNLDDILVGDTSRHILSEMLDLHEVIQNIGRLSAGQNGSSAFQLAHVQLHHMLYLLAAKPTSAETSETLNEHTQRLNKQLDSLRLRKVPIDGDGDCAFSSVIHQLGQTLSVNKPDSEDIAALEIHLASLGLVGSTEEQVFRLRELFVLELMGNKDEYMLQYTNFTSVDDFLVEAERFRYPHVFSGQLGDLVIKVLSIILQCPIAVVTSMKGIPLVPFLPEKSVIKTPLFIAFTQHGPGHYDGTCPAQAEDTGTDGHTDENIAPCRCGRNTVKKDEDKVTCANITVGGDDKVKYKTRCQCFKNGRDCSECLCLNCGNENNAPELLCPEHNLHNCRRCNKKRKETEKNTTKGSNIRRKRKKGTEGEDFLNNLTDSEKGQSIGLWTQLENCLFEVVHSLLASTCVEVSAEHITKVFNFVCNDPANMCLGLDVRAKSQKCVQSKLDLRRENLEGSLQKSNISTSAVGVLNKSDLQYSGANILAQTALEQPNEQHVLDIARSVPASSQLVSTYLPIVTASSVSETQIPHAVYDTQGMAYNTAQGEHFQSQLSAQQTSTLNNPLRTNFPSQTLVDSFKNVADGQQSQIMYDPLNPLFQYFPRPETEQSVQPLPNVNVTTQNLTNIQGVHAAQNLQGGQNFTHPVCTDQAINATLGSNFQTLQNVQVTSTVPAPVSTLSEVINSQVKTDVQDLQPVSYVQKAIQK